MTETTPDAVAADAPDGGVGSGDEVASEGEATSGSQSSGIVERLRAVDPTTWIFAVAVVATVPLVLFHYGRHQWFLRDEWFLLTDNSGFPPLLEPSAGAHWVAIPRLIYRALWSVWGVTTYRPYAIANLLLHLLMVVMLRELMRRSGINRWLATAAAIPMLLFGPGQEGLLLAFQVGFTGSMAWGLLQLVLADLGEDRIQRRDYLALGAGLLAITSSGIGVTTTFLVALALLIRRGWRSAAFHSVPLGIIYTAWMKLEHVQTAPLGRPSLSQVYEWDKWAVKSTFLGLGYFKIIAIAYIALIVVAAILVIGPWRDRTWPELRKELGIPVAMAVTVLFFATTSSLGRWYIGPKGAGASRYVYLQAACLLPLLAASAQIISRRWKVLLPGFVALFLIPVPFNTRQFGHSFFNENYYSYRRRVLTTAVRMPFATEVPPDVRPVPDPFDGPGLTIGFLLQAEREGRLNPSTNELSLWEIAEFKVRLGFAQDIEPPGEIQWGECKQARSVVITPEKGQSYAINKAVDVQFVGRGKNGKGRPASPPVRFQADGLNPLHMTATLPDLRLRIKPADGKGKVAVCPTEPAK